MSSVHDTDWEQLAASQARGPASDGNNVHIYERSVENKFESKVQGRPIYMSVPYIEIRSPNMPKSVFNQPLTAEHQLRYPQHWSAFQKKEKLRIDGTPINEWQEIPRTRAMELEQVGVYTVEQLSAFPDDRTSLLGEGGGDLRKKAAAWLEGGISGAERAELVGLRQKVAEMEQQIIGLGHMAVSPEDSTPDEQPDNEPVLLSEKELLVLGCVSVDINKGSEIAEFTTILVNEVSRIKKALIKRDILKDVRDGLHYTPDGRQKAIEAGLDVTA